jgi:peptide-methionine (S)-S-oxide reductase
MTRETATFAAGCFWGIEAAFRRVQGVLDTHVGYAGGTTANPTYEQVCSHATGHAEAVEVSYDPSAVSYDGLLNVFWTIHNPTTKNRQGPDVGSQYRSEIFYHTDAQREAAERSKANLAASGRFKQPVVTEMTPASTFWRAEAYHQRYHETHGAPERCPPPHQCHSGSERWGSGGTPTQGGERWHSSGWSTRGSAHRRKCARFQRGRWSW